MSGVLIKHHNPLAAKPNQVERIHVTRGEKTLSDAGVKSDKFMGVMINNELPAT